MFNRIQHHGIQEIKINNLNIKFHFCKKFSSLENVFELLNEGSY
jgi:hypothetical protein